jgi:recombination protein RecR
MSLPKEVQNLSELFGFLPGIGPKLSNRLSLYLAVSGKSLATRLSTSLDKVVTNIKLCDICSNITTGNLCEICLDSERNLSLIIVVEDSLDLYNIEQTGEYKGVYQVLGGLISPVNGIGPDDLKIEQLINRVKDEESKVEVVLALNATLEGDATGLYIKSRLEGFNIKITKLAKGIPSGGDIEFASTQTLIDSLKSRSVF